MSRKGGEIETGYAYSIRLPGVTLDAGGYGPIALVKAQDAVMRFIPIDHPVEADVLVQAIGEPATIKWRVRRADGIVYTYGPSARSENIVAIRKPVPHIPVEGLLEEADVPAPRMADMSDPFYAEPCRVCGKRIPKSGKRGRPPVMHDTCKR